MWKSFTFWIVFFIILESKNQCLVLTILILFAMHLFLSFLTYSWIFFMIKIVLWKTNFHKALVSIWTWYNTTNIVIDLKCWWLIIIDFLNFTSDNRELGDHLLVEQMNEFQNFIIVTNLYFYYNTFQ